MEDAANVDDVGQDKKGCKWEYLPHMIFNTPGGAAEQFGIRSARRPVEDPFESDRKAARVVAMLSAKEATAPGVTELSTGICIQHTCGLLGLKVTPCKFGADCIFRHVQSTAELVDVDFAGNG